jgi:hypothetical protein
MWLGGTTACDIFITGSMLYAFFRLRTGISTTDTILTRLSRYVIETGLATSIIAVGALVLFVKYPSNNLHNMLCVILTKTYSNSLMAVRLFTAA